MKVPKVEIKEIKKMMKKKKYIMKWDAKVWKRKDK